MRKKITHEAAFAQYLAMRENRSLANLRNRLLETTPEMAVSNRSLQEWSSKYNWQARAAEFDREAGQRLVDRTQTLVVQRDFNRVESLMALSQLCLDTATAARINPETVTAQDLRALAATAIDALKMVEVLTGGVSDRQERVGGIAAEALQILGEIEAEKRSRAKTITLKPVTIDVPE